MLFVSFVVKCAVMLGCGILSLRPQQDTLGPIEAEQLTHEQRDADDGTGVDKRIEPARSDPAVEENKSEKSGGDAEP